MQMLKKLFKSKNYYLELDDIKESQPVQTALETASKVSNTVQEKAANIKDTAQEKAANIKDTVQEKVSDVSDTAQKKAANIKDTQPVQKALKTADQATDAAQDKLESVTKTKTNSKKKSESKADTAPKKSTSPQDAGASSYEPPFWVAAMYNNSSNGKANSSDQKEQTFAPENLMPIVTKYRRRPGPSLNKFKDMASKTRSARR